MGKRRVSEKTPFIVFGGQRVRPARIDHDRRQVARQFSRLRDKWTGILRGEHEIALHMIADAAVARQSEI